MRLTLLSVLGLAFGLAAAVPQGKCPLGYSHDSPRSTDHVIRRAAPGKKGVFLMNRIGPSQSVLYVANQDGSNPTKLLGNESAYEYHAQWSQDGQWITFTSERAGDGNSDIYRVRANGTGLEQLVASPAMEDAGVLSPDNSKLAFVSTAGGYKTNIWVLDLKNGSTWNITNTDAVKGVTWSPDGYFSPQWSPDGEWIIFSSDRNTAWTGHGNGTGWEHTQELSIYAIHANGTGFRKVVSKSGYCLGSPKFSPDGKRVVYYELLRDYTWNAHRPEDLNSTVNQIVSVDFATGLDRREETSSSSLKIAPQYVSNNEIGYLVKGPTDKEGFNYTSVGISNRTAVLGGMRSPAWSPDGTKVVYESTDWTTRPMDKPLYSWQEDWEYRFTDVFPVLNKYGKLAMTKKQIGTPGDSSIVKLNPNNTDWFTVFNVTKDGELSASLVSSGLSGAFQPDWSPNDKEIAFGFGAWFQERAELPAWIYRATSDGSPLYANGSSYEQLTFGSLNSGYPSYSPNKTEIVYRVWGAEYGLRVMNLTDKSVRVLTNGTGVLNSTSDVWDNLPHYSPDGSKILFTRRINYTNYDIFTIKPDGTDLTRLTTSGANDAHAVWTDDGRIMWSTGMHGFKMECATYDQTFQPYGQNMIMNADGSNKTVLSDSVWEDSMPLYVPNEYL